VIVFAWEGWGWQNIVSDAYNPQSLDSPPGVRALQDRHGRQEPRRDLRLASFCDGGDGWTGLLRCSVHMQSYTLLLQALCLAGGEVVCQGLQSSPSA